MGSGQPLWASVGIADTMRIGGDVGVQWSGTFSADSLLRDLPARNFANHILWQVDPDPVLLRSQYHYLTDAEVSSLALFSAMSGGVMMTSDNLAELSVDRLELWKSILNTTKASARYPLLGREDSIYVLYQPPGGQPEPVSFLPPLIVQVRDNPGSGNTVHIVNISSDRVSRTIPLKDLGIEGAMTVFDWGRKTFTPGSDRLVISLDAHNSALLVLSLAASPTPEN
jgi:alpha-galactosidase